MKQTAEESLQAFLEGLGLDLQQAHMTKTPARVTALYKDLFRGLGGDTKFLWGEVFPTDYKGLVAVHGIPFYSMCEHHLMPFFGKVDIVYLPHEGRVAGLSKLADLVDLLARRPQLQERLSSQIADALEEDLGAQGVMVRIQATHLCMLVRGKMQLDTQAMTMESRGLLAEGKGLRQEALLLLGEETHEN